MELSFRQVNWHEVVIFGDVLCLCHVQYALEHQMQSNSQGWIHQLFSAGLVIFEIRQFTMKLSLVNSDDAQKQWVLARKMELGKSKLGESEYTH